jgi:hypothetical protein
MDVPARHNNDRAENSGTYDNNILPINAVKDTHWWGVFEEQFAKRNS